MAAFEAEGSRLPWQGSRTAVRPKRRRRRRQRPKPHLLQAVRAVLSLASPFNIFCPTCVHFVSRGSKA